MMNKPEIELSAFTLLRFKKFAEIMKDLNNTYRDQRYEYELFCNIKSLLSAHPIERKPTYQRLFFCSLNDEWIVLFNDQINSDGCASLMYNFNRHFQYEGMRIAFNEISTMFSYYREKHLRVIQSYKENNKWIFYTKGDVLEFERPEYYKGRMKKERFNVTILNEYFEKLNIPSVENINMIINKTEYVYCAKLSFI